jgi:hypothetical protein
MKIVIEYYFEKLMFTAVFSFQIFCNMVRHLKMLLSETTMMDVSCNNLM